MNYIYLIYTYVAVYKKDFESAEFNLEKLKQCDTNNKYEKHIKLLEAEIRAYSLNK